ncbi:MAG: TIGR02302 family protein [Alphaproteobacteria bacterium]|nr:TIGR02302 family protein [Alphaproteobacteria bacterium]
MTGRPSLSGRLFSMRLRIASLAVLWERVWPSCWPALAALGVFLVLGLFDVLPSLPGFAHAAILIGFGAAFASGLAVAFGRARIPNGGAARRRIEQASGLRHRPLQALADRPSGLLDTASTALWEAHRRRMEAAARHLRIGLPHAGFAARDPWGLRSVLAILLLLGAIDAGSDWRDRLVRSLRPDLAGGSHVAAASLDIWVTPPDYTGLAPQFLRPDIAETLRIPTGSKLLAQVHGGPAAPRLAIDGENRDFAAVDKQNFRAEATLTAGKRLSVTQAGAALGSWQIEIIPDNPPTVAFAKTPEGTTHAALRIDYRASDDYGVESIKAVIRREGGNPDEKIELEAPLPGLHLKEAQATSYHDLSPHPWAGLPVEIRLVATDALGQTGESDAVRMKLPERKFQHPVARAIIDQRKELASDPGSRLAVADTLSDLRERPQLYRDDTVAFLAMRLAEERLRLNDDANSIAEVQQLLWDTALRIEDGRMSLAEREMRRLQQELQDALAKNAPDEEIDRLVKELQQALDHYLQALAENMARNPEQYHQPVDPSKVISSRDLQRMLDRARDLARNGARDQARELLSQLQNMLENLRMARPGQMPQQGSSEAQKMMRDMREMMQRQQQLLDRSFRAQQQQGQQGQQGRMGQRGQQGQQGQQQGGDQPDPNGQLGDAAGQQEGLRRMLGEMMRRLGDGLGDIPEPLGRAERAMRDATEALQHRQPGDAIGPQTEALDQLQQAARDFAQQMQRRMQGQWGNPNDDDVGATDGMPRDRVERDPLGRPLSNNGTYDQGDVKIPDQNTLQKAREILDELRRRAGERYRPEIELDYIDRLLKRF